MNMQYFWLVFGLFGIIGAIIPAAQMGTDIYFDINFMDYQSNLYECIINKTEGNIKCVAND